MGIQVAWEDVFSVVNMIIPELVVLGIALVAMIAAIVLSGKKPQKGLIRMQSLIAFILVVCIVVNVICLGTLRNTLAIVFADIGAISEETAANSLAVVEDIAEEGIIMLKNDDNGLPLSDTTNINVFGWASTSPIYGGTGSGAVDASTATDLLTGLRYAGFVVHDELAAF